ncbi:pilus assembly protein [Massilia violaceinigra]|uniref:Pilus assembly protein n=1 Tax=Massilia violaceinigra TaxID=2045208 RepID=A0ABY3ZY36_9BURK|nr:TadE family protein [Massilia violaceinigra]UOD27328.1 pilus assembly protein [Massilia violaceinigra]
MNLYCAYKYNSIKCQSGQAMVEMTIVASFVVIIFLAIFYLGKFHDIQASTIQAARYASWERTVKTRAYSDSELQQQTRARLYTWNTRAFKSTDGATDSAAWENQNDIWKDHASGDRLVDKPQDVTIHTVRKNLPNVATAVIDRTTQMVSRVFAAISGGQKLPEGGMYTSTVSVKLSNVASLPAPLNELNLTLNETSAIITDNWDSNSPSQVAERTRVFTGAGLFNRIMPVIKAASYLLVPLEPDFLDFEPGQICPDIVPADRVTGSNLPAYGGAQCF